VSIHCPLNASTHHLIGERELGLMKPGAFLINCARGAIVDQKALVAALAERRLAGAGLDVFEQEPVPADDPIKQLDNVIRTPHQAHWSVESSIECRRTAVEHVLTFLKGGLPLDVVNRAVLEPGQRR
jgi:phosphoglycerate dehydrogenase-like enzyme